MVQKEYKMYGYAVSEFLIRWLGRWFQNRDISLNKVGWVVYSLGILAPVPLFLKNISGFEYSYWLSPILLLLFVLFDGVFSWLERVHERKSRWSRWIPFSRFILVMMWYQFLLGEVAYSLWEMGFIRYINILVLSAWVSSWVLVVIYLKKKNKTPSFYSFIQELQQMSAEYKEQLPFNYLTLALFFMKKDRIVLGILLASFLEFFLLYLLFALAGVTFFVLMCYSLFLLLYIEPSSKVSEE